MLVLTIVRYLGILLGLDVGQMRSMVAAEGLETAQNAGCTTVYQLLDSLTGPARVTGLLHCVLSDAAPEKWDSEARTRDSIVRGA